MVSIWVSSGYGRLTSRRRKVVSPPCCTAAFFRDGRYAIFSRWRRAFAHGGTMLSQPVERIDYCPPAIRLKTWRLWSGRRVNSFGAWRCMAPLSTDACGGSPIGTEAAIVGATGTG
jgi:hypothetical protein